MLVSPIHTLRDGLGFILGPRESADRGPLRMRQAAVLAEHKRSLATTPNRFRSLVGEARAAKQAGGAAQAREAYQKLLAQCPSAAPERPELAEAEAYLTNQPGRHWRLSKPPSQRLLFFLPGRR